MSISLITLPMPICKFYDTISTVSAQHRCMGLDIGKKTIGIAVGDAGHKIASPLKILWRTKLTLDACQLIELIDEYAIGMLVVGWPLNMDGSQGPKCDSVRDFAHAFLALHDINICFHDERLSTAAVERTMIDADMTRQMRSKRRDALAAAWILQSAFDGIPAHRQGE